MVVSKLAVRIVSAYLSTNDQFSVVLYRVYAQLRIQRGVHGLLLEKDLLFIVGAVIITDTFPNQKQALAGSIFNTVYQFGSAVGIGIMAVASSVVTADSSWQDKTAPGALLEGYRATFWACLGAAVLYCGIGGYGLKGIGKVGLKTE